ncbi:hypothetical protein ACOSQ3_025637 [Xanthoceras sorbifolium]
MTRTYIWSIEEDFWQYYWYIFEWFSKTNFQKWVQSSGFPAPFISTYDDQIYQTIVKFRETDHDHLWYGWSGYLWIFSFCNFCGAVTRPCVTLVFATLFLSLSCS